MKPGMVKKREHIDINDEKININFIGLTHFIMNKEKTGRNEDLKDLKYLENI